MMFVARHRWWLAVYAVLGTALVAVWAWNSSLSASLMPAPVPEVRLPRLGEAEAVFFWSPACGACLQVKPFVESLPRFKPGIRVAQVPTTTPSAYRLKEEYCIAYSVPERLRGALPMLFVADRFLIGPEQITNHAPAALLDTSIAVVPRPGGSAEAAEQMLVSRFTAFGVVPVFAAGLADSINPCAITSAIFLVAYLLYARRTTRELVQVGVAFTATVFATYFLIGLGLFNVLWRFQEFAGAARLMNLVTAVTSAALAYYSLRDARSISAGQTQQIALQIPASGKRLLHSAIRRFASSPRHLIALSIATALCASLLEFVCTSQVYLPTLMYMTQVPGARVRAATLLAIYNAAFVLPLVVLFGAAVVTSSIDVFQSFVRRRLATLKYLMAATFGLLALYFSVTTAQMFGL